MLRVDVMRVRESENCILLTFSEPSQVDYVIVFRPYGSVSLLAMQKVFITFFALRFFMLGKEGFGE